MKRLHHRTDMNITSLQIAELRGVLSKFNIEELFDERGEEGIYIVKYKEDYFEFIIKRIDFFSFTTIIRDIHCKAPKSEKKSCWQDVVSEFDRWVREVAGEIRYRPEFKGVDRKEKLFSKTIQKYSKKFIKIYNQARQAELNGLDEICGLGYRKAFEFLVKDYVIQGKSGEEKREIRKEHFLGKIIDKHIPNDEVKKLAHRASWLGNDHAHYFKEWKRKTLEDLKKLIDLVVSWIELDSKLKEESNRIEKSMPGKKKAAKKEIIL